MFGHLFYVFPIFICKNQYLLIFFLFPKYNTGFESIIATLIFFHSSSQTLQQLISLYSLSRITLSPLHNQSSQHLRDSSCVINSLTLKSNCQLQWRSQIPKGRHRRKICQPVGLQPSELLPNLFRSNRAL